MCWEELRAKVLKRDGYHCQLCGSEESIITHHITYDLFDYRKVPERFLLTLCRTCHDKTFQRRKYKTRTPIDHRFRVWVDGKELRLTNKQLREYLQEHPVHYEFVPKERQPEVEEAV